MFSPFLELSRCFPFTLSSDFERTEADALLAARCGGSRFQNGIGSGEDSGRVLVGDLLFVLASAECSHDRSPRHRGRAFRSKSARQTPLQPRGYVWRSVRYPQAFRMWCALEQCGRSHETLSYVEVRRGDHAAPVLRINITTATVIPPHRYALRSALTNDNGVGRTAIGSMLFKTASEGSPALQCLNTNVSPILSSNCLVLTPLFLWTRQIRINPLTRFSDSRTQVTGEVPHVDGAAHIERWQSKWRRKAGGKRCLL
jgi:hypothetical protein